MDRPIVYPGAIPLDTDLLSTNRNLMVGIGWLAQVLVGTAVGAIGLPCTPTAPPSMVVEVGPGAITGFTEVDTIAYGDLGTDTSALVKMGINQGSTSFTLTAPSTSGQSINYLIEGEFQEVDGTSIVLPYYNSADPGMPFAGPDNSGTAQNTVRSQIVGLQLKAGAAAPTGTQTTPAVDAGWVPLYVITVNFGQTTITAGNISVAPGAPFLPGGLTGYAPINSPLFTGTPAGPAPAFGDRTTRLATTNWVGTEFAPINNPILTGTPQAPTPVPSSNNTDIATTGYVTLAIAAATGGGGRAPLSANLDIYVSPTGNDTTNNGLSVGSPFQTLQHAYNTVANGYDLAGFVATIHCADGTYSLGIQANGLATGATGPSNIVFVGNLTTPSNALVSVPTTGAYCFSAINGAAYTIAGGFKFLAGTYLASPVAPSTGSDCVEVGALAQINITGDVIFSWATRYHMNVHDSGTLVVSANYQLAGAAYTHIRMINGATVTWGGTSGSPITAAPVQTPDFSGSFGTGSTWALVFEYFHELTSNSHSSFANGAFSFTTTGGAKPCTFTTFNVVHVNIHDTSCVVNTFGAGPSFFNGQIQINGVLNPSTLAPEYV